MLRSGPSQGARAMHTSMRKQTVSMPLACRPRLSAGVRRDSGAVLARVASISQAPVGEGPSMDDRTMLSELAATQTALAPDGHPDAVWDSEDAGAGAGVAASAAHEHAELPSTSEPAAPSTPLVPAFSVGDVVTGRVIATGPRGARVEILEQEGVIG